MSVKNGFSTLNRLLGKKSKDKNMSKSSSNLSLATSSHLEPSFSSLLPTQNRITPLPAATSNAPFEQTFRITVLLPRGQLFVARLGAKVKLEKLLEIVCENKQLDPEIYEFRHSSDTCQVFNLESTIGAVGLTEIRLCHKSEAYDNFNADEIIKLRHQTVGRDSLTSSEFSSRNSKNCKTASPYSSTNSLNSMDSTGMNTNYRAPLSLPPVSAKKLPPTVPSRKKRAAPKPPIENNNVQEIQISTTNGHKEEKKIKENFQTSFPRKDFHVSTPNLILTSNANALTTFESSEFHQSNSSIDCNGNSRKSHDNNIEISNAITGNGNIRHDRGRCMSMITQEINIDEIDQKQELNDIMKNLSEKLPEPCPRKMISAKKKSAAPAPPPRHINGVRPVAKPRVTTSMLNLTESGCNEKKEIQSVIGNVSKVMLNQNEVNDEPTEPTSPTPLQAQIILTSNGSPPEFKDFHIVPTITAPIPLNLPSASSVNEEFFTPINCDKLDSSNFILSTNNSDDTQADSGIGEPVPSSPIPDSIPSNCGDDSLKSHFESSSDDEEQIKVYNIKLGKTIPLEGHKNLENMSSTKPLLISDNTDNSTMSTSTTVDNETNVLRSNSPNWTYTIPAPPNFADDCNHEQSDSVKSENSSTESACDEMKAKNSNEIEKINAVSDYEEIVPVIQKQPSINFDELYAVVDKKKNNVKMIANNSNENEINSDEIFKKCKVKNIKQSPKLVEELNNVLDASSPNSDAENNYNELQNVEMVSKDSDGFGEETKDEQETIVDDYVIDPTRTEYKITKADVITELNKFICDNGGVDSFIRRNDGHNDNIESAGPCNLSNFKISTYSQPISPVKTFAESKNNLANLEMNKIDSMSIKSNYEISQKNEEDDEKLYRKRLNQNHFTKSNRNITRSDSFHSTAIANYDHTTESLPNLRSSRSSSFLSLLAAQKQENSMLTTNLTSKFVDTNRQKSSSELSIGESPRLQSLIVMKSILNCRKNSLNNENETDILVNLTSQRQQQQQQQNTEHESPKKDDSQISSQKNFILDRQPIATSVPRPHTNTNGYSLDNSNTNDFDKSNSQPEKKWKYQGPPSINLSTWNERPKVQTLTIKNEGDYIFGNNVTSNKITSVPSQDQRNSMTSHGLNSSFSLNNQTHYETNLNSQMPNFIKPEPRVPFVRSVEYKRMNSAGNTQKLQQEMLNNTTPSIITPILEPSVMTLGRMSKLNRQVIPTVKGFQSIENDSNVYELSTNIVRQKTNSLNGNQHYRYTLCVDNANSIEDKIISNKSRKSCELNVNDVPAFAKVQLRKTGIKDKNLSTISRNAKSSIYTDDFRNRLNGNHEQQEQNFTKLEINLNQGINNATKMPLSTTIPQPPPPIIRSVVTKQNSNGSTSSTSAMNSNDRGDQSDPRLRLLEEIRDFKRCALKQF